MSKDKKSDRRLRTKKSHYEPVLDSSLPDKMRFREQAHISLKAIHALLEVIPPDAVLEPKLIS